MHAFKTALLKLYSIQLYSVGLCGFLAFLFFCKPIFIRDARTDIFRIKKITT